MLLAHLNELNGLRHDVSIRDGLVSDLGRVVDVVNGMLSFPRGLVSSFGSVMGCLDCLVCSVAISARDSLSSLQGSFGGSVSSFSGLLCDFGFFVSVTSFLVSVSKFGSRCHQMGIFLVLLEGSGVQLYSLFSQLVGLFGKLVRRGCADSNGLRDLMRGLQCKHRVNHFILGTGSVAGFGHLMSLLDHVMGMIDEMIEAIKEMVRRFGEKVGMLARAMGVLDSLMSGVRHRGARRKESRRAGSQEQFCRFHISNSLD